VERLFAFLKQFRRETPRYERLNVTCHGTAPSGPRIHRPQTAETAGKCQHTICSSNQAFVARSIIDLCSTDLMGKEYMRW
jgi:hypothetical protein